MINIRRSHSGNSDFINLVKHLDLYLAEKDGSEHSYYDQYNKIDDIKHVVVAYNGDRAVGCGAIKEYSPGVMEVKRMFTLPENRGQGIATIILVELEQWAAEMSYKKCILETGKKQTEAVALYPRRGYTQIPNYGQYAGMANSICFEKKIK